MLKRIGVTASVTSDADRIRVASKLILPGVGAFDSGMRNLATLNLLDVLTQRVLEDRIPVLGICLGMQLLAHKSEEGVLPGLGWISGRVVRFRTSPHVLNLRVPHMGWNQVTVKRPGGLFRGLTNDSRFYFVHSYHFECDRSEDIVATSTHGCEFVSAVQHDNVLGVQFHPEKSHRFGVSLFTNFIDQH